MNKGILSAVLVFVMAYAAVLWLKFNEPPERPAKVVQGEAVEPAPVQTGSAIGSPAPVAQSAPVPGLATAETGAQLAEPPQPEVPARRMAEGGADEAAQDSTGYTVPDETDTPQPSGPEGDQTISGRVQERSGKPVPGIKLVARASYLFDRDRGKLTPVYRFQRTTTSGYDGAYAFERLADGEYLISTEATERYARAQISVRAGVDFADLVLTVQEDLRVYGTVTTDAGEPLAGVMVVPVMQGSPKVSTSKEGRYSFEVKLLDTAQALVVRAEKQGYEDREMKLETSKLEAMNDLELNIVMQPEEDSTLAEIRGRVTGPVNEPVAGQRIMLSSAGVRQNYSATTDADGRFVIPRVEPGDDYMLSINAVAAYKDYFQRDIKITKNGLTLNIGLEALDTGTLSGQMLNVFGAPIPNFSLVLQTRETSYYSQTVLGDAAGNFTVEKAPAGELRLKTKSTPYFTIEGIRLNAGADLQVPVVLDWGYDEIRGRVVNEQGYPVAVPNISLSWSHEQYGIRSSSRRTTSADEQGNFGFTQLGPGQHRLNVNASGYKPVAVNHDVALQGSEIEIKLQEK